MSSEVFVFVLAAAAAFGLSIGGVAVVYFLDLRRRDDGPATRESDEGSRAPSPFDRAV
jgi:hypothetical protein